MNIINLLREEYDITDERQLPPDNEYEIELKETYNGTYNNHLSTYKYA